MTSVAVATEPQKAPKQSPPKRGFKAKMFAPGLLRAAWMTVFMGAFGFGLVVGIRALYGFPLFDTDPIVTVILLSAPLGFLVGVGGFDYWWNYMRGKPTAPEDHSGH